MQLRDKLGTVQKACAFIARAKRYLKGRVPFIVNDRADLARITGATGIHVGQEDLSVEDARKIGGRSLQVGKSCQTLAHVRAAYREGADYVGFGSVYKTQTKPDRSPMDLDVLRKAALYAASVELPLFAIGGITKENMACVRACGVTRIAVCREILLAQDPARASRDLKTLLIVN